MLAPNKPEHANYRRPIKDAPGFEIERRLVAYAYPKNGNVHNPTPRYHWWLYLDGRLVDNAGKKGILISQARKPHARTVYSPLKGTPI